MKKKISFYAYHFCLCLSFLILPYLLSSQTSIIRIPDIIHNGHDRTYFSVYVGLLIFFYVNYYYFIPKLYFSNKKTIYFSLLFVFLIALLFTSHFFDKPDIDLFNMEKMAYPKPMPPHGPKPDFSRGPMMDKPNQHFNTILVYLTGTLTSLFLAINRRLQHVERDKMQAEISLLKAQINPHFLFNTLNSIYALAIRKDNRTADAIVQLSELMRYIIRDAHDDTIVLEKELNYINNYIELQRSRLGNTVKIDYETIGNNYDQKIAPLILISFIENAFKHGVNPDENSEIRIKIEIETQQLQLLVYNKKVTSVQTEKGMGLQNTMERLERLYPNRYQLKIDETNENYTTLLTIEL
ncbi:sensor histidine kinase [Flavobacterium cerinum]|uniref:Histidine kinase n=1 Tax=Flavobacterium cerinum TaxID=2502784 RepID=A0ABY5IU03_9FLAO|nr:histidine kinase [Flavobacterium cerinum]UUC46317.1 histidine kinase [Flavobacterium cerinum]